MHAFRPDDLVWKVTRDLGAIKREWLQLEQCALVTPFQRYAWIAAWYDAIGRHDGTEIAIVCAFANDRPIALFPLAVERTMGVRCLTWTAHHWNDYNVPLLAPEIAEYVTKDDVGSIWQQVVDCVGDVDICQLDKQPSRLAGRPNPFAGFMAVPEASSAHAVGLCLDWSSFVSQRFNRTTFRRLREKESRLKKMGVLEFARIAEQDGKAKMIETLLEWKRSQLNERGACNPFDDTRVTGFLTEAMRDESEFVQVYTLELNGDPIAIVLALACPDGLIVYQMAYQNGPLARLSPGKILLNRLMEKMIGEGQTVLDFSLGDESYKTSLSNIHIELDRTIRACNLVGILPTAILRRRLAIKCWIKERPRLLSAMETAHKYARQIWMNSESFPSNQQASPIAINIARAGDCPGGAHPASQ